MDCDLGALNLPGATSQFQIYTPKTPFTANVTVRSDTPDPNPANDHASLEVAAITTPHLRLECLPNPVSPLVSGRPTTLLMMAQNDGAPADDVAATVTFSGDLVIESIEPTVYTDRCVLTGPSTVRCEAAHLGTNDGIGAYIHAVPGVSGAIIAVRGQATASEPLYRPEDAQLDRTLIVTTTAALTISGYGDDERAPDGTVAFHYTVAHRNGSADAGRNVNVTITTTSDRGELTFVSATGANCQLANRTQVLCAVPDIPVGQSATFNLVYRAPSPAVVNASQTLTWDASVLNLEQHQTFTTLIYRPLDVTTTADFVPGSLRAAIDAANLGPCPCRVAFRIPPPVTIAPSTPLPPLTQSFSVLVDGNGQVELNGAATVGDGLVLRGSAEVRGLAIDGFSNNGILIDSGDAYGSVASVHDNDVERNFRGIWYQGNGVAHVANNVIRGNTRSGIFALRALDIVGNRITGNGASGVYLALTGTVEGNTIADNHEFGIGTGKAYGTLVGENSIFGNGGMSLDIGMDGPSKPFDPIRVAGTPQVTDAFFDGKQTVIKLHVDEKSSPNAQPSFNAVTVVITVWIFETPRLNRAGFAEAEHFLGKVVVDGVDATLSVPSDLRGHYITAIARRSADYFREAQFVAGSEPAAGLQVR